MRMCGKERRRRVCDAVRDCDSVERPAHLQVAKECVMGEHGHSFSLHAERSQTCCRMRELRQWFRQVMTNTPVGLFPIRR